MKFDQNEIERLSSLCENFEEKVAFLKNKISWGKAGDLIDDAEIQDYGGFAETLYLDKIYEGVQSCLRLFRAGEYSEVEGELDLLDSYIPQLTSDNQRIFDIDSLREIVETASLEAESLCRFKEPSILEPKIIIGVNDQLMQYITTNPKALHLIDSHLFEEVIAEIFRRFGLDVTLTKKTRDGGYDILAVEQTAITNNKFIVECKKFAEHRKVGLSIVRSLYGTKIDLLATKAFLVTTSTFTQGALQFQKQHPWELDLKDYNDIESWLQVHWKKS